MSCTTSVFFVTCRHPGALRTPPFLQVVADVLGVIGKTEGARVHLERSMVGEFKPPGCGETWANSVVGSCCRL